MKDLRFKIIADFIKGGFEAAGNAVGSLKAKFAGFFDVSKIGWAKIGGAAIAAVAGIKSAGEAIRAHWFGLMDDLEQATIDFDRKNAQVFRKIRFMNTETDKARLKESIENEIRDIRAARDKIAREEEAQSPLEKAKDFVEMKINERMGFGAFTDNELKIKRMNEQLQSLAKSLEIVKNTKVETFFEAVSKKLGEIEDADFLREVGESSPQNLVTVLEERASKAKESMHKAMGVLLKDGATEIERDTANEAVDTWKRYKDALVEARKALEDLNEESVSPAPVAPPTEKPKPKRKGYQMPQSERDRYRNGKDSRYRDEEDNSDPYAMDLSPSMTESNVGMTRRLRGDSGLSGRRGRRITSFSTPAHLADAIKNRSSGLGEVDANRDPLLLAMKEAQKTRQHASDLLERIEKKTGAAP